MDAADEDDEEEVGDVAALLALPPVVEVDGEAAEVAEGAEEEDGRDGDGERRGVGGHAPESGVLAGRMVCILELWRLHCHRTIWERSQHYWKSRDF